jgi:hypothetical protein
MNGIATPKRSMRRPQCAELDDLYVPVRHGQLIIVRTESAICADCNYLITDCLLRSVAIPCRAHIAN